MLRILTLPPPYRSFCLCSVLSLCLGVSVVCSSHASDWASWRGPEENGYSREKDLPETFSPDLKAPNNNVIWKAPFGGRTTPIVLNGRVYAINSVGKDETLQERVLCFDDKDGKLLWEHKFNVFLTDIVADRLGWTNLVGDPETGNIYAHGTQGFLICFDRDGKILWQHSLTEEHGRISGYGGRLPGPTIDGDLLIISMLNASWGEQARGGVRFLALDKKTGNVIWWGSTPFRPKDTYSSTAVVAVINGERLLIGGAGDGGVHAFKVRTGERVWSYIFGDGAVNLSPIVDGSRVYIGHGEDNPDTNKQGRVICLDASKVKDGKPEKVWQVDGIKAKFATPILHEGRLYVCDMYASMYCLDANTGKRLWRYPYGRNCFGSPVFADGKIYVGEVNGTFHILKPEATKCTSLHDQFFEAAAGAPDVEINGSPAVANGRVYFFTSTDLYCIGKKDHKTPAEAIPPGPKESEAAANAKPAVLQVVPADILLHPGESAKFHARLYDDAGHFLREVKAEWSPAAFLAPPPVPGAPMPPAGSTPPPPPPVLKAEVDADGKATVDAKVPGQFGMVVAKAEGLTGQARIRVAPVQPYQVDFGKVPLERSPGGWVNCQGKFAVKEVKGKKVLMKLATNPSPLVARANAFITAPTAADYTIQADLMGTQKNADLPDMGVLANRYHLFLDGNKQQLRLVSWDAVPRLDKTIAYSWKPEVWYTLKLTVRLEGDKGLIRGKIWEAGKEEPKEWTVELVDPVPNREGSAGLYANSTAVEEGSPGTSIYYDNVSVAPNKK
jgi:outer membrane protein assembly factor BamB